MKVEHMSATLALYGWTPCGWNLTGEAMAYNPSWAGVAKEGEGTVYTYLANAPQGEWGDTQHTLVIYGHAATLGAKDGYGIEWQDIPPKVMHMLFDDVVKRRNRDEEIASNEPR